MNEFENTTITTDEEEAVDILRSLKERCDPKNAALIVVDVQNDFVSPEGSAAKRGEDVSAAMAMVPHSAPA